MSKKYRMLLFDFFNTLVLSDASRRPTIEIDGERVVSTAHLLHGRLAGRYPALEPAQIFRAMEAARLKAREAWGAEFREFPALERFKYLATILGVNGEDGDMPQQLLDTHMEAVTASFTFPPAHMTLLERLGASHRLAIFSNFDHAPALLGILREAGIESWFQPIVISERIGFRKPGLAAFRHALALAGERAEDILFVGDSYGDDVVGARRAGMDVAWINPAGREAPVECRPTYELKELQDLQALLEAA